MGTSLMVLRVLCAAVIFLGFLGASSIATAGSLRDLEVTEEHHRAVVHPDLDPNYYTSMRKVPNGPDPIHNRRAGDSRRPPGRA